MKATVDKPVRSRAVKPADIEFYINKELIPLTLQLRDAANRYFVGEFITTTAGTGVATAIYASEDLASGVVWLVEATVIARAGTTARSAFIIRGTFYSNGTVTQEGATQAVYTQNAAGFTVAFAVVANHIVVNVTDDGALDVDWECVIQTKEMTSPVAV